MRRRRQLFWAMSLVIIALVVNVPRNELNDVFLHWFDDSIQFRADTDFVLDNLTGLYTTEYSMRARETGGISDPDFLRGAGIVFSLDAPTNRCAPCQDLQRHNETPE